MRVDRSQQILQNLKCNRKVDKKFEVPPLNCPNFLWYSQRGKPLRL